MITGKVRRQLLSRLEQSGKYECPICSGRLLNPEFDHMQPVSRQGTHHADNLWIICGKCNRAKSGRTLFEFRVRRKSS